MVMSVHVQEPAFTDCDAVCAANHVFLLEPSMDPAILQQAVGRAHRMGQTRPVHVTRLIMHSTVEASHPAYMKRCMHVIIRLSKRHIIPTRARTCWRPNESLVCCVVAMPAALYDYVCLQQYT